MRVLEAGKRVVVLRQERCWKEPQMLKMMKVAQILFLGHRQMTEGELGVEQSRSFWRRSWG